MSSTDGPVDPPTLLQLRYAAIPRTHPGAGYPLPAFAQHTEPAVRVVGIPDTTAIPTPVMIALDALAHACRDEYGIGVEVEAGEDREAAALALETIRRYLG